MSVHAQIFNIYLASYHIPSKWLFNNFALKSQLVAAHNCAQNVRKSSPCSQNI